MLKYKNKDLPIKNITSSQLDFFENNGYYSGLAHNLVDHCAKCITHCKFVDSEGLEFSHPHVRIGNRGEYFQIFAKTNVYSGYSVSVYPECTNNYQTIKTTEPFVVT